MPNPHELALEIERFLESPRGQRIEEVRGLATAYAEMCQSANERLRRCADYLRRGLRCEAIYHAEVEPDLLDTVAALDLKWFDQWDTTCEENDLDRPPRLQMEVAEEINEAYTAQLPMQEQLKQLRLLSLARAPLRARLHVLRTLAKKDPNNPMWEEDVRTFEAERIKEISAEAKQAAKAEDTEWLEDLLKEASRSRWRVPVPPNVVDSVRGLLRRVQTDLAIRKLNALLPDLSDAYSAASYEECAMLLRQWEQIVSADDVPVPEDLAAQIQPIVDWVGEQDYARQMQHQFATACSQLQVGLDNEVPSAELRKLHREATSFDQPIDEDLDRRFRQMLANRELAQRRRNRVRLAMITPFIVMGGIGVGLLVQRGVFSRRVGKYHGEFKSYIDKGQLDQAEKFFQRLEKEDPDVASDGRILAEHTRLGQERDKEEKRKADFDASLKQATADLATAKKSGMDEPNRQALDKANELAKTDGDKLAVVELEDAFSKWIRGQRDARDKAFRAKTKETSDKVYALDLDELQKDPDEASQLLTRLRGEVGALRDTPKVSDGLKNRELDPLEKQLDGLKQGLQVAQRVQKEKEREAQALAELEAMSGSGSTLGKALESFASAHPGSEKTSHFQKAAEQIEGWRAVEEWMALLGGWGGELAPQNRSQIETRLTAVKEYVQKFPASPFNNEATRAYTAYLERAQATLADENPWMEVIKAMRDAPYMKDMPKCVKTSDAKVYYLPRDGKVATDARGTRADVILTTDTEEIEELKKIEPGPVTEPAPCPQWLLAKDLMKKLSDLRVSTWETFGLEVTETIRTRQEVDAVLRAILLETIFEMIGEASWGIDDEINRRKQSLPAMDKEDILWMDPDDNDAAEAREECKQGLDQLGTLLDLKITVLSRRQKLSKSLFVKCVGTGVALRDDKKRWQLKTTAKPLTDGQRAMAVIAGGADGPMKLVEIGAVKEGKLVVNPSRMAGLPEGSMFFIFGKGAD